MADTNSNLIVLRLKPEPARTDFPEDVKALREAMNRAGYAVTDYACAIAWERVAQKASAGWLIVRVFTDEEIVERMLEQFDQTKLTAHPDYHVQTKVMPMVDRVDDDDWEWAR